MKLNKKVSIVTGGAKGIGKATALLFSKEGAHVVICDTDDREAARVAGEITQSGGSALPVHVDISSSDDVKNMVDLVMERFGKIDILVNNAGIQTVAPFFELKEEDWRKVIDVNLTGTFICSRYVTEKMKEKKKSNRGKIVNVASAHHDIPRRHKFHYDASKSGIAMFTKELALELAEYKINVNCVAPGAIDTPMNADVMADRKKLSSTISKIPWKRVGTPEEVAKLILFLVSDDAEYITGSIVRIDGGRSLTN